MTYDQKVKKLINKLKTDGEDLYQLSVMLYNDWHAEEDVDQLLEDIIKIKDDIIKSVAALKKEIK